MSDRLTPSNRAGTLLVVGRDLVGDWVVYECGGAALGRFSSFQSAWVFAQSDAHGFSGATLATSCAPSRDGRGRRDLRQHDSAEG
jgi:hypothetical protein